MNICHDLLKVKYFIKYFIVKIRPLEDHLLTSMFRSLTHMLHMDYE